MKIMKNKLLTIGIVVGIITVVVIVFMMKMFFSHFTITEKDKLDTKSYKTIPTEEQVRILHNSDSWGEDLEDIKKNGMDSKTQAYVEAAQIMMRHLEEKYGEPFMVGGGKRVYSGDYEMFVYALEGEYAHEKFETIYGFDDEGNAFYEDGYYLLRHTMEVQEELQKLADENELDIKIIVHLHGTTAKEGKELYEVLRENWVTIGITGFMRPRTSEKEFNEQLKKLKELILIKDVRTSITLIRLKKDKTFDSIDERGGLSYQQMSEEQQLYDLRGFDCIEKY